MKVLLVDQYGDLGGAQRSLLETAKAAAAAGWRVFAGAPADGLLGVKLKAAGATVAPLECGRYSMGSKSAGDMLRFAWRLPRLARRIGTLIEESRADLLFVNGPRLLPAAAWAARRKTPVLFHCHSRLKAKYAVALAGRSIAGADAYVVSASRYTLKPLLRYARPRRWRVVYNGAPPPRVARRSGSGRIGVIGRIAPEKGQTLFLGAARLLEREIAGLRYVLCGAPLFGDKAAERYFEETRRLAAGLPVEFLGEREDVDAVLSGLDLLVVPSAGDEATTRVIPEAYAARVPVVTFDAGGIGEIVADGETGFLVRERTAEALAARIAGLLRGERERLEAAPEAGHEFWKRRLTLERFEREILAAMEAAALGRDFPEASA